MSDFKFTPYDEAAGTTLDPQEGTRPADRDEENRGQQPCEECDVPEIIVPDCCRSKHLRHAAAHVNILACFAAKAGKRNVLNVADYETACQLVESLRRVLLDVAYKAPTKADGTDAETARKVGALIVQGFHNRGAVTGEPDTGLRYRFYPRE